MTDDTYTYKAYGETQHAGANEQPFQWVGELGYQYDAETDRHHLRRRDYDSHLARFLSQDPPEGDDDPNRYGYASNDPVNGSDPSGLIDDFGLVNSGASSGSAPIKDIPAIVHGGVENLYAMPGGKSIGQYVPKSNRVTRRFSSGKVVAVTNDKLWEGLQKGVFKQDWTTEQWDAWFVANGEVITPAPTTTCGKAVDEMTIDEKWQEAIGIALAKGHIDGEAKQILDELKKPENALLFAGVAGALWSLVLAAEAAGASSVAGGPIGWIIGGATFLLTADITLAIGAARSELDSATTCADLEDASKNVGKAVVKLAAAGILAAIVESVTAAAACVGKSQPKMLGPRRPVARPAPKKPTQEPSRKPEPLKIDERPDLKDARKAAGSTEKELHTNPPKAENRPPRTKRWEGLPLRSNARGPNEAGAGSYVNKRIALSNNVPDGVYKYVIDAEGNAWLAPTSEIELPHSALVPPGERVRVAGYVAIRNGKANVNGHSGHYMEGRPVLRGEEAAHEAAIRSTFADQGVEAVKIDPGPSRGVLRPPE